MLNLGVGECRCSRTRGVSIRQSSLSMKRTLSIITIDQPQSLPQFFHGGGGWGGEKLGEERQRRRWRGKEDFVVKVRCDMLVGRNVEKRDFGGGGKTPK